jgi:thiol-disulfide isomerase/thioredoxin
MIRTGNFRSFKALQPSPALFHAMLDATLRHIVAAQVGDTSPNANMHHTTHLEIQVNFVKNLTVALVFSLFSALTAASEQPDASPLFASTLHTPDGKPQAIAQYRGKPLVVNFWARWCPPCRAEIPELAAFQKEHRGRIEVLGIGLEDDGAAVSAFMKQHKMDYTVLLTHAQGMPLMQALGNKRGGLPYTLFIDRNGRVVGQKLGLLRQNDLKNAANLLLGR